MPPISKREAESESESEAEGHLAKRVKTSEMIEDSEDEQLIDTTNISLQETSIDGELSTIASLESGDAEDSNSIQTWRERILEKLDAKEQGQTWGDILLASIEDGPEKDSLVAFIDSHSITNWPRGESMEDVDDFLVSDKHDWANHDTEITERWGCLVAQLKELLGPEYDERLLAKPSGPLSAILTVVWHYPTPKCDKSVWGSTYDKTNPSLITQMWKVGSSPFVRTQDSIPIRKTFKRDDPKEFEAFQNWPDIEKFCLKFSQDLNVHSKFIIIVGQKNAQYLESLVNQEGACELVTLSLDKPAFPLIFNEEAKMYLVRDKDTKAVRHVVFLSNHSQAFYHNPDMRIAAYHDLLWNAALEFSSLPISRPHSFTKMAAGVRARPAGSMSRIRTTLGSLISLRQQEKQLGVVFGEDFLRANFKIDSNVFENKLDKGGSYVGLILESWATKSSDIYDLVRKVCLVAFEKGLATLESEEWSALVEYKQHLHDLARARQQKKKRRGEPNEEFYNLSAKTIAFACTRQAVRLAEKSKRPVVTFVDWRRSKIAVDPDFESVDYFAQKALYQEEAEPISFHETTLLNVITSPATQTYRMKKALLERHVVFYSPTYLHGLRWPGDGCPEPDNFDYSENHPAVSTDCSIMGSAREKFR